MITHTSIARAWRSAGRGMLSATGVLGILSLLILACHRKSPIPDDAPALISATSEYPSVKWRERDLMAWSRTLPNPSSSVVQASFSEIEGVLELLRMTFSYEENTHKTTGPIGATVEFYDNPDCKGPPVAITDCMEEGCVVKAVRSCYKKYPKNGCVIIKWRNPFGKHGSAAGGIVEWAATLTKLPMRPRERAIMRLVSTDGRQWQIKELELDYSKSTFFFAPNPTPLWMIAPKHPALIWEKPLTDEEPPLLANAEGTVEFSSPEALNGVDLSGRREIYLIYYPPMRQ